MKKFLLVVALLIAGSVYAQQPGGVPDDPSLPDGGGTATNGVVGGSAPLAGGITLLVGLAIGYAGLKLYRNWLEQKQTNVK